MRLKTLRRLQASLGIVPDEVCVLCGHVLAVGVVNVDHILPRQLGGLSIPANYRVVHRDCNANRGSFLTLLDLLILNQRRLLGTYNGDQGHLNRTPQTPAAEQLARRRAKELRRRFRQVQPTTEITV